jgi:excisionase family DNA binding protein
VKVSEEKDLLRPRDTARRLGVSLPQIYHLAATGRLPCVRIGRSVRFRPADVDRFIRDHRRTKPAA